MRYRTLTLSSIALLTIAIATAALAQAPGQDGTGRPAFGPGRGMPEQMRDTFRLMMLPRQISALNEDARNALTPAQAKKILSVVKPLRQKSKLTSEEAKKVSAQLDKVFTPSQKEFMSNLRPFGRRMNRRPGGEGNRPGEGFAQGDRPREGFGQGDRPRGEFGQGGDRPRMRRNPDAMKDFNPFYTKSNAGSDDRFAQMRGARMNEFFSSLEKTAAKASAAKPVKKKK